MAKRKSAGRPAKAPKAKRAVPAEVSACARELGRKGAAARWAGHTKKGGSKRPSKARASAAKAKATVAAIPVDVRPVEAGLARLPVPAWMSSERLPVDSLGRALTVADVATAFRAPLQLPGPSSAPITSKAPATKAKLTRSQQWNAKMEREHAALRARDEGRLPVNLGDMSEPDGLPPGYNIGRFGEPVPRWMLYAVYSTMDTHLDRVSERQGAGSFTLTKGQAEAIRDLARSASREEIRPHLAKVYVIRTEGRFLAFATDAHCLAMHVEETEEGPRVPEGFALPWRLAAKVRHGQPITDHANTKDASEATLKGCFAPPTQAVLRALLGDSPGDSPKMGDRWFYVPPTLASAWARALEKAKGLGAATGDHRRGDVTGAAFRQIGYMDGAIDVGGVQFTPEVIATGKSSSFGLSPETAKMGASVLTANVAYLDRAADFCSLSLKGGGRIGARMFPGPNYLDPIICGSELKPSKVGRLALLMPMRS